MKQNPSIMFHGSSKSIGAIYLSRMLSAAFAIFCGFFATFITANVSAAEPAAEDPAAFNPAIGFKPAQSDLTEVFLQIAGSLEFYGSPEPYLRHMKTEHERIEAKYQKQMGSKLQSFCPSYMDAAYLDRFAANWKHIAPQLGLESLAKNTGRLMQAAINGTDGKGIMLVEVFNEHQHQVYVAMTSRKAVQIPGFDTLQANVAKCLLLNEPLSPATGLTAGQQAVVQSANQIRAGFLRIFSALDAGLSTADAGKVKKFLLSVFDDVGRMAESEMEVGILDNSLSGPHEPQLSYNAARETRLNADEQKIFAGFMKKPRFTKADFPALDKFYQGPYDRLSERGKDEMSVRIHAGMVPADQTDR